MLEKEPMERVELHCHSKYSKLDRVAAPYDIVKFAQKEVRFFRT